MKVNIKDFRIQTSVKFYILQIVNHALLIYGIINYQHSEHFATLLVGLALSFYCGIVVVNVGLHRYFAHRSFKTGPLRELLLTWSCIMSGNGSPAMFCSIHRAHHQKADKPGDPHNPREIGPLRAWTSFWAPVSLTKKHMSGLLDTKSKRFVNKHYFKLCAVCMTVLVLIDPMIAAFCWALPNVWCYHGAVSVAVIPHYQGYRTYDTDDYAKNSWVTTVLSMGEGWHNNHHHRPGNHRQGEKWWEIDPPAWVIEHFFMLPK